MKIIVCFKNVPEDQEIEVRSDHTLDLTRARAAAKIGPYDLNAVEAAMELSAAVEGCQVVALTAGGEMAVNEKLKKGILSRGPSELCIVRGEQLEGADSYVTARVLRAAIERLGGADLILCGEGSGDLYSQQVGSLLGALMGLPTVNSVSGITPVEGGLRLERDTEDGQEVLEVSLPAVLSVTSDANIPRIPGMREILRAGKRPVTIWDAASLAPVPFSPVQVVSLLAPEQADRGRVIVEGEDQEAVEVFCRHIRKVLS